MGQNAIGKSGVVTKTGSGTKISHHQNNSGLSPFPLRGITELTSNTTMTAGGNAGVNTMSGSAVAVVNGLTGTMPAVSAALGSLYVVRATSAHNHCLSGSASDSGSQVFYMSSSAGTPTRGSKLQLGGAVGDSVVLMGTGLNYLVLAHTGSVTLSQS